MTTYRVPIANPLLAEKDFWLPVEGFRLVSVDSPWLAHHHAMICTFEDDNAPAELEGKLVELVLQRHEDGMRVIDRIVLPETGQSGSGS